MELKRTIDMLSHIDPNITMVISNIAMLEVHYDYGVLQFSTSGKLFKSTTLNHTAYTTKDGFCLDRLDSIIKVLEFYLRVISVPAIKTAFDWDVRMVDRLGAVFDVVDEINITDPISIMPNLTMGKDDLPDGKELLHVKLKLAEIFNLVVSSPSHNDKINKIATLFIPHYSEGDKLNIESIKSDKYPTSTLALDNLVGKLTTIISHIKKASHINKRLCAINSMQK